MYLGWGIGSEADSMYFIMTISVLAGGLLGGIGMYCLQRKQRKQELKKMIGLTDEILNEREIKASASGEETLYARIEHQLVAGPIVRARDFIPQIRKPLYVSQEMFGRGIFLIVAGLFKKAVISDYISINFVERIFDNPTLYSGVENLMGLYGYALQIFLMVRL